jgi:succinoglycan biosynthesis transport protein ExoP
MAIIGVLLAAVFAVLGYRSTGPKYESMATIRIAPRVDTTLYKVPEQDQTWNYQSFLATNAQYLRSRRVIENALNDESLLQLEWAQRTNVLKAMEDGLEVNSNRRDELIYVKFEADDPVVAQTACNAVINSYDEIYISQGSAAVSSRIKAISDEQAALERQLNAVHDDIQQILGRHRTTDLKQLHTTTGLELDQIEQQLEMAEQVLARRKAGGDDAAAVAMGDGPLLRDLVQVHPRLDEVRRMRDAALTELEFARRRYRPGTPHYKRAEEEYQTADAMYQQEYQVAVELWLAHGSELNGATTPDQFFERLSQPELEQQIAGFREREGVLRQRGDQLINDIQLLNEKELRAGKIQSDLDFVIGRRRGLETEEPAIAGRISVQQRATKPLGPSSDGRKRRAVAGVGFGFVVSFGLFFLLGTFDRRTYGAGQLRNEAGAKNLRCLGVLPDLGRSATDTETSDVASHCVHQIRNQIEVVREPLPGYAIAISSPFQGDGKTSIVMALGWSYAAAGYRTLLVDCDFVGRSLSRQLGMIGREGLKEALIHRDLNDFVADLPVEHLSVLPVGVDSRFGPETLRRVDLTTILDQARSQYEMIIIDTGPLLGSLESTPVTSSADGVVLSLRRGRSRTRLEECVKRLDASGATSLGVILNCVGRSECYRYVSEASLAAADHGRHEGGSEQDSVIRTSGPERNVLMAAMEGASRHHDGDEESPLTP